MIYVTGDTHGDIDVQKLGSKKFLEGKILTKDDYVVVLGDFGHIWDGSRTDKYWQKWLDEKSFTTLFIDGNHENHDLLDSYKVEMWNGGKIHKVTDSIFHLMRGQVFIIDGKKFFTFGGAKSDDKDQRVEGKSWWAGEMPTQEEYDEGISNLEKHNWEVDYVFTHTCPTSIQEKVNDMFDKDKSVTELNEYLEKIDNKLTYKKWCFGHNHRDAIIDDKHEIFYNKIVKL